MSRPDVPLLKESRAFVQRLAAGIRAYGESRHGTARRTNWSYRYADDFHDREAELFAVDPDAYLAVQAVPTPVVEDVFKQQVTGRKLIETLLKVGAHWTFSMIGGVSAVLAPRPGGRIYRKCYVDDVENVFDPKENGVVRHVFPFPLNLQRQWKYVTYLHSERHAFRLAGYPYSARDLLAFLRRRDIRALERLEARAQIRLGLSIRRQRAWEVVQLSDEFEICCLDFVGAVRRPGLTVVNSAHGVGKYFPVHAFDEFRVLTHVQKEYYQALWPCQYVLNDLQSSQTASGGDQSAAADGGIQFVFVSQTSDRTGAYLDRCEGEVLQTLSREFAGEDGIELLIKAHPNRTAPIAAGNFRVLKALSALRSPQSSVFVSFYSTSHVDPAFVGRRFLLSYDLIRPDIAFDDDGTIVSLDELLREVKALISIIGSQPTPLRDSEEG